MSSKIPQKMQFEEKSNFSAEFSFSGEQRHNSSSQIKKVQFT